MPRSDAKSASKPGPLRVLCASASPDVRKTFADLCTEAGFQSDEAAHGEEVRESMSLSPHAYEALIIDDDLPRHTALETVERLRAARYSGHVLVHTLRVTSYQAGEFHRLFVSGILIKGTDLLKSQLQGYLSQFRAAREPKPRPRYPFQDEEFSGRRRSKA